MENKKNHLTLEKIYSVLKDNPTASIREILDVLNIEFEDWYSINRKMLKFKRSNKINYERVGQDIINIEIIDKKFLNKINTKQLTDEMERNAIFLHLKIIDELDKLIFNNATSTRDKLKAIELRQREYKYENNHHAVEYYKLKEKEV